MKIVVEMSSEEFLEFTEWQKDKDRYKHQLASSEARIVRLAKSVDYAVEPDPKKKGKYKIVDQDHMDDLYELAGDILADL